MLKFRVVVLLPGKTCNSGAPERQKHNNRSSSSAWDTQAPCRELLSLPGRNSSSRSTQSSIQFSSHKVSKINTYLGGVIQYGGWTSLTSLFQITVQRLLDFAKKSFPLMLSVTRQQQLQQQKSPPPRHVLCAAGIDVGCACVARSYDLSLSLCLSLSLSPHARAQTRSTPTRC